MSEPALARVAGTEKSGHPCTRRNSWLPVVLSVFAAFVFYLSIKATQQPFDYTFRIGNALLQGHLGLLQEPPSWLNEMVGVNGEYYSVFPLGAVLTVMPIAALGKVGLVDDFPGRALAAVIAGVCVYFFFELSGVENSSPGRRILLAVFPIFGTWAWCNLGFGGAWQIALGFALLGETAALYFTLVQPRPLLAGTFFSLAFGNRSELILALPIFIYLWLFPRNAIFRFKTRDAARVRYDWRSSIRFLVVPAVLVICTAAYNFARFHNIFDFGYAHIPHLLGEPWYSHGLFSLSAIPWNIYTMFFEGMQSLPAFPYIRPYAFGCSIFLSSPCLFLLFREGGQYKAVCWIAICVLTFALWCHGNPGGWQFSYRYAIVLIPWMFLLLAGNGPRKVTVTESILFFTSAAINALATYQFLWTSEIKP